MADFQPLLAIQITPLLGAVCVGFLMTTILHEFLHAWVAYLGGDRSEYNRRQLADPRTYIHPLNTLGIPLLALVLGGLPLMGGAVLINRAALRSREWALAVDLAGVAGNFAVFLVLGYILRFVTFDLDSAFGRNLHAFVGTLCFLQILTVLINLTPVPPLDGAHAIGNFLNPEAQAQIFNPQWNFLGLGVLFLLLNTEAGLGVYLTLVVRICGWVGVPIGELLEAYNYAFFGAS